MDQETRQPRRKGDRETRTPSQEGDIAARKPRQEGDIAARKPRQEGEQAARTPSQEADRAARTPSQEADRAARTPRPSSAPISGARAHPEDDRAAHTARGEDGRTAHPPRKDDERAHPSRREDDERARPPHREDDAGARPPRREGDQLRYELLQAAAQLAATPRPVAIPSLRAVARTVGVSASAVYRHFPSQSALTRALLLAQHTTFEAAVLDGDDPRLDVRARMRRLAREYVRWGLANPGMYQLLFESADQLDADSALPNVPDETMRLAWSLLTELRAQEPDGVAGSTDPAVLAERLWTRLHGIVSLRIHKPAQPWLADPATEADALVDHLD